MNFFGAVSVYAAYWVVTLMICLHIPYMFLPYNFSMFPPIDGGRIYKVGQFCDPILYVRSDFHCHVVWVWKFLLFAQGQKGEPGDVPVVSVSYI